MATEITKVGQTFALDFTVTQEQINAFANLCGDMNPIHTDPEYAKTTRFGATIAHGVLTGSIFSKIFGMLWPGEGTVYVKQDFEFKAPAYANTDFTAELKVLDIQGVRATISTKVIEKQSNKEILNGTAIILNKEKIRDDSVS